METTYEEKVTGEIRRLLRSLEEACEEQKITIEQAIAWWSDAKRDVIESKMNNSEELSYREKAQRFVQQFVEESEQPVCVETLCFLYGQEKCPTSLIIVNGVCDRVVLPCPHSDRDKYVRNILWEFIKVVDNNRTKYYIKNNWSAVKNRMFMIAKSL